MYLALRKVSLRRLLPRIVTAFALAFLLLLSTGFGIFRLMAGPRDLNSLSEDALSGQYVSFDAMYSIAAYASFGSEDSSTAKKQYYVLAYGDKYLSITAGEDYYNLLDAASDQAQEHYQGDLETLSPLGAVTGTVTKLDEDLLGYMISGISGIALPGASTEDEARTNALAYTVRLGYVGWLPRGACIFLSVLALLCLLYGAAVLALALSGHYQKQVKALVDGDGEAEADFAAAPARDQIRVGRKYTWFFNGPKAKALRTADIVWAFCEANPLVVSRYKWPMAMYMQDKSYHYVGLETKQEVAEVLKELAAQGYPFVEGYSPAKNKQFSEDFSGFMVLARENQGEKA